MKTLREKLPDTVSHDVFDCMPPNAVCQFSRVSKDAYYMVKTYITRTFSILHLLMRFFGWDGAFVFWQLMASTGALISGSSALQFFDRTYYPEADLDVYLEERRVLEVANWLLTQGYFYVPRIEDVALTLAQVINHYSMFEPPTRDAMLPLSPHSYSGATMVLTFENAMRRKKVQLITADFCPLQLILRFHSTAVLNVISYSRAYSLYPMPTLVERRSLLQLKHSSHPHTQAITKYTQRGWLMMDRLSVQEAYDPSSPFSPGVRSLGDSRCWTISLDPPFDTQNEDNVELNRWLVTFDNLRVRSITATIFTSDRLMHGYTVTPCQSYRVTIERFNELKREFPHIQFLDSVFAQILSH